MTFSERAIDAHDLGARQHRWLSYLWMKNKMKEIRVCQEYEPKRYTKWEDFRGVVCPIDHRSIIDDESVIEFDNDNREKNVVVIGALQKYFTERGMPCYIQDHGGRSPHLHVFNVPPVLKIENNPVLRGMNLNLDMLKKGGHGLCREIGGRYPKLGTFASYFTSTDDIRPIMHKNDVRFPCLSLN